MKTSNLALQIEPPEDQPAPPAGRLEIAGRPHSEVARVRPRPRRSLVIRSIVIRDQGLRLFRCG